MDLEGPVRTGGSSSTGSSAYNERPLPPIPDSEPSIVSGHKQRNSNIMEARYLPREEVDEQAVEDADEGGLESSMALNVNVVNRSSVSRSPSSVPALIQSSADTSNGDPSTHSQELTSNGPHSSSPGPPQLAHSPPSQEIRSFRLSNASDGSRESVENDGRARRSGSSMLIEAANVSSASLPPSTSPGETSISRSDLRESRFRVRQGPGVVSVQQATRSASSLFDSDNNPAPSTARNNFRSAQGQTSTGSRIDDGADSDISESSGDSPLLARASSRQIERRRQRLEELEREEFVVPRWQPDAEVTLCPICGTQFSKILAISNLLLIMCTDCEK